MRIEPVYLVAPKPEQKNVPTRRAFLIAGGTFLAGLGLGGACGFAAGSRGSGKGEGAVEERLEPTGNAELDELRRLAVEAPVEELMEKATAFLDLLAQKYDSDKIGWRGADRIADQLLNGPARSDGRLLARWLMQVIERRDSKEAQARLRLLPRLAKVR
ncbi:MAG: hypothetical protein ACE37K_11445 [Planctomycetota bacterium]